jgi:hypothetical protein
VPEDASLEEIKSQFRRKVLKVITFIVLYITCINR